MKNLKKGFTLIELLVVVAIIGILASVVLGALNSAKKKGEDASIQSNLANIRTQAAIYYEKNGNFGTAHYNNATGSCDTAPATSIFGDPTIQAAFEAAETASGSSVGHCVFKLVNQTWAVSMPLKSNPADYWCVDSDGASEKTDGDKLANNDADCD